MSLLWIHNRLSSPPACFNPSCTALAVPPVVNNLISNDWHFSVHRSICIKVPSIPVPAPPSLCVLLFDFWDWDPEWHRPFSSNVPERKDCSCRAAPVEFLYNTERHLNKTCSHICIYKVRDRILFPLVRQRAYWCGLHIDCLAAQLRRPT